MAAVVSTGLLLQQSVWEHLFTVIIQVTATACSTLLLLIPTQQQCTVRA